MKIERADKLPDSFIAHAFYLPNFDFAAFAAAAPVHYVERTSHPDFAFRRAANRL
jgi:hypothetical protein